MNKAIKTILMTFYWLLIGIMIGYTWRMYHDSYTGISASKTPRMTVKQFVASQPDIAIDMTKDMPIIKVHDRYKK